VTVSRPPKSSLRATTSSNFPFDSLIIHPTLFECYCRHSPHSKSKPVGPLIAYLPRSRTLSQRRNARASSPAVTRSHDQPPPVSRACRAFSDPLGRPITHSLVLSALLEIPNHSDAPLREPCQPRRERKAALPFISDPPVIFPSSSSSPEPQLTPPTSPQFQFSYPAPLSQNTASSPNGSGRLSVVGYALTTCAGMDAYAPMV